MKLYNQQSILRLGLMSFAMLIAFASLYYTNNLVVKLGEREQKLIDLYAKGLETAAKVEDMGNLAFLFQEIIQANTSVPVILANSKREPISFKNLDLPEDFQTDIEFLQKEMDEMEAVYQPIEIEYSPGHKNYIYYKNSDLLTQLKYYPYIQLTVIFIFIILGYLVINNSRRAEQNRVWVGMAKETAHQLATPLSSLMAWNEIFKSDENFSHPNAVHEMEKDVKRLEMVTSRFSNIGSLPSLKAENILEVLKSGIDYLKPRISSKVHFEFIDNLSNELHLAMLNRALFDWALENIIKNGVDAMGGIGMLTVTISEIEKNKIIIDISDTGKGIPKNKLKTVFNPGFTTKQRGWGLGLTLTKRIIEQYHGGRVFVKSSESGKGAIFRIIMNKVVLPSKDIQLQS